MAELLETLALLVAIRYLVQSFLLVVVEVGLITQGRPLAVRAVEHRLQAVSKQAPTELRARDLPEEIVLLKISPLTVQVVEVRAVLDQTV